ncbi:uncharacterized protein LOC129766424 [Toxorhynchites rutilus septentrionalis]|uniref:uncharacterized protein LOC129766424 n=1 Tax=Toxorhynchites rutilus septentrionalis TaxID=329112 RepID=UPI00247A0F22|nr:uncharacterized protein LOC129766424 [Toxorhynchites rutilus septentrionalis]
MGEPITHHSIVRLELCAARLATQLFEKIQSAINLHAAIFFWADSTTVLPWLRASPSRWKPFVANRVSQIQHSTDVNNWRHVPGIDNPADDISRGLNAVDIMNCERWWNGPSWLSKSTNSWPQQVISSEESASASSEQRKIPVIAMNTIVLDWCNDLFTRYSSFGKLRRVVAFCMRYVHRLRELVSLHRSSPDSYEKPSVNTDTANILPLNTDELNQAEIKLCHLAQQENFPEEINDLQEKNRVSNSSPLRFLKPFIDPIGIIRVCGRLHNAALPHNIKHPMVLSAKHPLTVLLTRHFHLKLLHAGPQLLLATLRQKYWILGGRNLTKFVYHHCHTCFRSKPTLVQQSIADLPASRVSPTRPFSICGVDYCGPFFVKSAVRKHGPTKVYVAIFVCFSTRAVHIELVSDLSTAAFLASLRRFVARRGKIVEINSDNATTFKGASHALNKVYRMLKIEEGERQHIFNWSSENEIHWKFIPHRAPHFGGLWEAAVKSAKTHMLKVLNNVNIRYEDLLTLLAQVEMCLNSRPLTPMSTDPSDLDVLTPGHFLTGGNLQAVPEAD